MHHRIIDRTKNAIKSIHLDHLKEKPEATPDDFVWFFFSRGWDILFGDFVADRA